MASVGEQEPVRGLQEQEEVLEPEAQDVTASVVMKQRFVPRTIRAKTSSSLIWSQDRTRSMFVTERCWPSFVGAKRDIPFHANKKDQKANNGLLPVLLWREQEQYLASRQPAEESSARRKRKLEEVEQGDDEPEGKEEEQQQQQQPAKKSRAGFSLASVWSFIHKFAVTTSAALTELMRLVSAPAYSPEWDPRRFTAQCRLPKEEYQLRVFGACQEKGYFVGPGDVYGGDYNIYRGGDPSNSHSTATIRVVRKRTITGRDLLSFSRVQNQVAKSAVLAFIDPDHLSPGFLVVNFRNVSERL
jgi:hypothetical protein